MEKIEVKSPYDGKVVGTIEKDTEETLQEKLNRVKEGALRIKKISSYERGEILIEASKTIKEREREFAETISLEVGKTIHESLAEVRRCVETIKLSGEEAKRIKGEQVLFDAAPTGKGKIGFYKRVPIGVVAAITPFNFPLNLVAHKIGPALAAGCSVILKPATKTPLSAIKLQEVLISLGIPKEAFEIVIGPGDEIGEKLVESYIPRMITFTGSKEVGERISKKAGMKRFVAELGSNSACIIFPDADIERAAKKIKIGGYALAGQVCISVQRVYVHESIFERFLFRFVEEVKKIKTGDPLKEDTDMGPMISSSAVDKILAWIDETVKEGAEVVLQGERKGNILDPWIIKNAPHESKLIQQEAFAPVVVVNPFKDTREVINWVNNTPYGLQAGIFTNDIKKAFTLAEEIDTGGVLINEIPTFRVDLMPYGGVKGSGMGREGPYFAIREMTEEKLVVVDIT